MNILKYTSLYSSLLLTACIPSQPISQLGTKPLTSVSNQLKSLNSILSWTISGAIAVKNVHKGWSAAINWQQQGLNQYSIHFMGPLGGGAVSIVNDGHTVNYQDANKHMSSENAQQLLREQTGINLPIQKFFYWMKGQPAPGNIESIERDQSNHLVSLQQEGYQVHYFNYTTVNNIDLPGKIQLDGHGITIKLVIKHWLIKQ
ncbi:MAG: lipoprotein insertase outer membrane protein LolB [Legionella sp.]